MFVETTNVSIRFIVANSSGEHNQQ